MCLFFLIQNHQFSKFCINDLEYMAFFVVFFVVFVSNTVEINHFYMSLCPYANVLIPFIRIYRLSSKHDKDLLLVSKVARL